MHGRPRRPAKPEDEEAASAKAAKLRDLQAQVLHNHHGRTYTKEAIGLSFKLLEINPEAYTAWNYRKLAFQHNVKELSDPEAIKSAVDDELRVVEVALRQNPKSYGAWYHRKWLLCQKLAPVDFKREFGLLDKLLKVDARNFHGWNYRRFLARFMGVSDEEELKYTMDKISDNFSNYSAWHNRSILLSNLLIQQSKGFESKQKIFSEEFELVTQALFTDPSDQSGWFYHLWLLAQTSCPDNPQLIASWPSNAAKLSSSLIKEKAEQHRQSSILSRTVPIVLYFNEPVKGLNQSSVNLKSDLEFSKDIIWRPLTMADSGYSNCWATDLQIINECSSLQEYSVEVSIPCSNGIVSRSGSNYNCPVHFTFGIELISNDPVQGLDMFDKPVAWNCSESFQPHGNRDPIPFDLLKITSALIEHDSNWHFERLSEEIDLFRELPDDNSKFGKLTLARLLLACSAIKSRGRSLIERKGYCEEALGLFTDLIHLDPSHKQYYEDERSLVLMDKLTCDMETFMKHCSVQVQPNSAPLNHVQLCRLSLTCIGFAERLLWVQMLDLSHNSLRSVEGLEALQHLVFLNISNNQISGFTALESLTKIISLKVLDLSFNKIGAHSIDTTRYICSSPFSHKMEASEAFEAYQKVNINVEEYWDAILFFRSLKLAQLDIKGNAVASKENFRTIVMMLIPCLKWFDGEDVN
ncbi:Geranylgeranyl transferase type-2 subunit alpha 1 [Zea mays]|uniref:Geranylgeranyl transferase type-2 subunit alpha n=2 Tax=Zea mays TaxID=4577 RepID=B6U171_MAIZE|nr:rab geranylgeranyl transferase like protein [Zea mays]ACG43104.1 rab geranylgeranyl transferase like protein [Zea mays]AQK66082.1 Rab geranylgeranyl transferase like protein [Zea mays]PWZ23703.1 Geranylgeranyl transferase type-2 subunit alpha 1 [Zea mays]|eukprot:NP_001151503.1 rab geranylgeranyl transferase like protein [Zea mays]